jgi:flagellar FliJ protein
MSKAKKSKRFRYPLEALLKYRIIREKQAEEAYQQAQRKFLQEEQKEKELMQEENNAYVELRSMMESQQVPDMNIIKLRKHHIQILKKKVLEQRKIKLKARDERDLKREKLNQAIKEKKINEKDKEKTKEKWRRLMEKEEVKFLDDIAGIQYTKKMNIEEES